MRKHYYFIAFAIWIAACLFLFHAFYQGPRRPPSPTSTPGRRSMSGRRNIAWMTDIHLNFLQRPDILKFCRKVAQRNPDAVLLGGDIGVFGLLPLCRGLSNGEPHDYDGL